MSTSWKNISIKIPVVSEIVQGLATVGTALSTIAKAVEGVGSLLETVGPIINLISSGFSLSFGDLIKLLLSFLDPLKNVCEVYVIIPDPIKATSFGTVAEIANAAGTITGTKMPYFQDWVGIFCNSVRFHHEGEIPISTGGTLQPPNTCASGCGVRTFGAQINFNGVYNGFVILFAETEITKFCGEVIKFSDMGPVCPPKIQGKFGYAYSPATMSYDIGRIVKPYRIELRELLSPLRDASKLIGSASGALTSADGPGDAITRLGQTLEARAQYLELIAEEVSSLSDSLSKFSATFSAYVIEFDGIQGVTELQNFLLTAANAPNNQFVGGIGILAQSGTIPVLKTILG